MNDPSTHPQDLLPWYVNGSLSDVERRQVETHLQQCADCRAEVGFLQSLGKVVREDTDTVPAEFMWHRLQRDMRRGGNAAARDGRRWWLPSLAAAALVVIAIQGVALFNLQQQTGGYQLAGKALGGTVLQAKLVPAATEKQIRDALAVANAEIISGPSAAGVYRVRLREDDARTIEQRIDLLRTSKEVIDYLERD